MWRDRSHGTSVHRREVKNISARNKTNKKNRKFENCIMLTKDLHD